MYLIEALRSEHERKNFRSSEEVLNTYLKNFVMQDERRYLTRTFVLRQPPNLEVLGFYTLSAGSIHFASLPEQIKKKFPKYPILVLHLGRLAVATKHQGQKLGEFLLFHAMRQAVNLSENIGVFALEVRAKNEEVASFYKRYDFQTLVSDPLRLFLPIAHIKSQLES